MPITLTVDPKSWQQYERQLRELNRGGVKYAMAATLNDLAFAGRKKWTEEMSGAMKLRNTFTQRSLRVERARPSHLEATLGSLAEYMAKQELGGSQAKRGKHGVPLPAHAPGGRKLKPATPRGKRMGNIKLMPTVKGSPKQQVAAAISMAKRKGGKVHAYLEVAPGRRGIFQVSGGRSKMPVRKVWDLSKARVVTKANPTMQPAVRWAMSKAERYWAKNLAFQLKRLGAR